MIIFRNRLLEVATVESPTGAFPKHTHDEFVISANVSGHEQVWLDGKSFDVGPSTVTTYNPGQLQASTCVSDVALRCVSLYVHADGFRQYFDRPHEFDRACLDNAPLSRQLLGLGNGITDGDAEEACLLLLSCLMRGTTARRLAPGRCSPWATRLKERLLSDMSMVPDLSSLAATESMSPAHLVRRFRVEVGLPPLAWFMQQRVAHGRHLLRLGVPIAQAALDSGFADQAHFTKAFVRFSGMTPGRFRHINF